MREDDLKRILQSGSATVGGAARPRPAEAIRARGNQRRRRKAAGTALLTLAIVAAGGGAYAGVHGGGQGQRPAPVTRPHRVQLSPHGHRVTGHPAPVETMLPAGRTGTRAAIPWDMVTIGWSLTESSTGRADEYGQWQQGGGRVTLSLVDPAGGRYTIYQQANTGHPWTLLAWSGDGRRALLGLTGATQEQYTRYGVITLATGSIAAFAAPADVTPAGFTRPDGTSILAVQQSGGTMRLQRYTLAGALEATLASHAGAGSGLAGCELGCGAISSFDGTSVVWSAGGRLQLVSNAGGVVRDLPVPGTGSSPSCLPLTWWDTKTVLVRCAATGDGQQLWLVPAGGGQPSPLGPPVSPESDYGVEYGAWSVSGTVYINETAGSGCPQAPPGPSASAIFRLRSSGSLTPVPVPGSEGGNAAALGVLNEQLLVLARTGCPGSGSLLWLNPATGATQPLQMARPGQAGVVAADPFNEG